MHAPVSDNEIDQTSLRLRVGKRAGPLGPTGAQVAPQARVRAHDFSVCYGANEAVKGISLEIMNGYVTAIIGPSGCGKSTFLRAINRMNDLIPRCFTKGELLLDGHNVYHPRIDVTVLRKKAGMVFQKPNPFPKSIFDNIAYGPRLHGVTSRSALAEVVEVSLKQAALWDEVKDRLRSNALGLSGGLSRPVR